MSAKVVSPVLIKYSDLVSGKDIKGLIEKAYGYDGLGILAVHGIPEVGKLRRAVFKDGYKFASMDDKIKVKYEHKASYYSFGWSHGKEKLQGHPDYSKGSYYNNPLCNQPFDKNEKPSNQLFGTANVWPTKELPSLETNFMAIGQLVVKVGLLIAKECDHFIEAQSKSYTKGRLHNMLSKNKVCKARLLHYFPLDHKMAGRGQKKMGASEEKEKSENPFSSWCGWHNDHSSLTGLVVGQFVNTETGEFIQNPDPDAGLYIRSRKGELYRVTLPSNRSEVSADNTLLFQIGETSQIHSGGLLQATPHAVRGANVPKVSRESYAVFMQPAWDEKMDVPQGTKPELAQSSQAVKNLPAGVPSLSSRYGTKNCPFTACNYAAFTTESLAAYH